MKSFYSVDGSTCSQASREALSGRGRRTGQSAMQQDLDQGGGAEVKAELGRFHYLPSRVRPSPVPRAHLAASLKPRFPPLQVSGLIDKGWVRSEAGPPHPHPRDARCRGLFCFPFPLHQWPWGPGPLRSRAPSALASLQVPTGVC